MLSNVLFALVTRIHHPGDRRVQEISLTETGRKLLSEALFVVRELNEDLTAHLADGDRRALERALEAVRRLSAPRPPKQRPPVLSLRIAWGISCRMACCFCSRLRSAAASLADCVCA